MARIETKIFKNKSKKRPQDFSRERKMGFKKLIYFLLSMVKESSQNALERFFDKIGEGIYMSQQAFSLARQKIKWEAFLELFVLTVNTYYMLYKEKLKYWKGFRLHAIDGIKYSLPNDPQLSEYFGTSGAGNISPTAQGSALYDILNNIVVDAQIEPMTTDERTLARKHIRNLVKLESYEEWRELILFDRGYSSFALIKELMKAKIHFVMRVRNKFSIEIDELNCGDYVIDLEQGGEKHSVRVLKFLLDTGEEETLISDILEKKIGIKDFKELYFKRWSIETKYDQVKNKLEIENFSGRLVDNIRQDFYATMILTNVAAELINEAQELVDEDQKEKENKYTYKVNVNHTIGVLKDRLIKALCEEDDKKRGEMIDEIIVLLEKKIIPIRPDRSFPRSRRKAKFHHNHKSNC